MQFIRNIVHRFPKTLIFATLLITGFLGYHAFNISINTDLEHMFPENDPAVQTFDRISDEYGGSEFMVFVLEAPDVLSISSLRQIDSLTTAFSQITGVSKVRSITNIEEIRGEDFTIQVGRLMPSLPKTQAQVATMREKILHKPRYMGTMVSNDFRYANILIQLKPSADQKQVYQDVERLRSHTHFTGETYFTGSPVLTEELAARMKGDIIRLLPFVTLVVMLILFWAFRSARGIFLPLVIVFISLICTLGFSGWLGHSLSIISTSLPILLVSVGSAYAIHLLARYYEDQFHGLGKEQAVSESILNVGIAIVMAGVTTVAGFSSLGLSRLAIIKDFGLLTAFGILIALIISITFLPATLLMIPAPTRFKSADRRRWLDYLFDRITRLVHNYPWVVLAIVLVCIGLSLWVIPKINPETNYITFFPRHSNVREAHELVNKEFGGAASLEIIINTGKENGIENPQFLQRVAKFQKAVSGIPTLSHPMSVVDLLEEENQALHGDDPAYNTVPDAGIAQYLLLLESGSEDILSDFIDFNHQEARIRVMSSSTKSRDTKAVLQQVQQLVASSFGSTSDQVTVSGVPVLGEKLMDLILTSQIRSLISAVIFAFLITSLLLKSVRRGAFCSLPIALTVLLNFGIMGWSSIPLDVATSMIASIAVGIGIDYSIHFYSRYLEEKQRNHDVETALSNAIHTVGRANYFNAFAVTAGFLVLLFSTFPPLRMFGLLSSITMVLSFLGAMILLPSLIMVSHRIKVRRQSVSHS